MEERLFHQYTEMFSIGIVATGIATFVGNAAISPDRHGAFITNSKVSFLIFRILCLFGMPASLSRGRVRDRLKERSGMAGEY